MSDTAVVGIIGIFATAVIGPLIAYHIRKDEEGRRETIAALDGAVDALTTARGTVNWIQGIASEMTGRQRHVDVELRRSLDEIHAAESYATRLHLRLGQKSHHGGVCGCGWLSLGSRRGRLREVHR